MNRMIRRATACSMVALMAAAAPAFAAGEDAAAPATPDIVVTGLRAALRDALNAKRASPLVVETISSKDIGVMPDVTIADELTRLPGINSSRDRGNDSQASVRGLGPRLVLGLVNGREVASSEPDRNVRWEIYPSEDVSSVIVYKSQDASLIAGGVAATIDIRTLRPLDYAGPAFNLRAGALYGTGGKDIPDYDKWGARASGQWVGKLSSDFAIALGGSYQKQKNAKESFQGWGYNLANTPGDNAPTLNGTPVNAPWGAQTEIDATTETRWSATGALQWKPDANWDVNADLLYSDVKIAEPQWQQWYGGNGQNWGDWAGTIGAAGDIYQPGSYTLTSNDITGATLNSYSRVTNVIADYNEDKHLLATGLNARYRNGATTLKFDASYSRAVRDNAWAAIESQVYPQTVTFNTAANVVPGVTESSDPAAASAQNFFGYTPGSGAGPQHLVDSLGAFAVDFEQKLGGGLLTTLSAGARYSHRVKSLSTGFETVSVNTGTLPLSEFSVSAFSVPNLVYGAFDQVASVTSLSRTGDPTGYWRVSEDNAEFYGKADFSGEGFSGNLGVRLVDVSDTSDAFQSYTYWNGSANVTGVNPVSVPTHYLRALPSLALTFPLRDDLLLHAGLARVMSRPPIDELRGAQILQDYSGYHAGSTGNPLLRPFMASQADLSLEWYFHRDALFALAGYYKKVDTNIGYQQTNQTITTPQDTAVYTITQPVNGNGGNVYGSEVTFQTPFWFVPGGEHVGVYANAALVGSDLHELAPVSNPLPAVGLATFTSQIDVWAAFGGLDMRVGLKHHSPYTVIFGWDASQLVRLESETTLQASIGYRINRMITVRVQAWNLTNAAARYYFNNDPNQIARYEKYGPSYMADVTVKF